MVKITRVTPHDPASEKKFHDFAGPSTASPLRIRSAQVSARAWRMNIVKSSHSSGICFTDIAHASGLMLPPALGREGAGVVKFIGQLEVLHE